LSLALSAEEREGLLSEVLMPPKHVLAIGAHPGDIEFHAGATLSEMACKGASVTIVVCTDGARGFGAEEDLVSLRRGEAERAAEALSAERVVFLGYPDGQLEATEPVRRAIVKEVRRRRPELVLTHDPTSLWRRVGDVMRLGHSDNRAAGAATLDAIHPRAELRSYYPELIARGFPPWLVREVWLFDTAEPDHFVDTSPNRANKRSALASHVSQLPRRLFEEADAEEHGVQAERGFPAEAFRRLILF
jgi:LmbE family N-acetylglucosaminyl deacetylase